MTYDEIDDGGSVSPKNIVSNCCGEVLYDWCEPDNTGRCSSCKEACCGEIIEEDEERKELESNAIGYLTQDE